MVVLSGLKEESKDRELVIRIVSILPLQWDFPFESPVSGLCLPSFGDCVDCITYLLGSRHIDSSEIDVMREQA